MMVLQTLWRLDKQRDELLAEAAGLADGVAKAKAAIRESEELIESLEGQLKALSTKEKAHNRRVAQYVKRRDSTARAMEEGRITDFLVAQKQVEDCGAIVDSEEMLLLEIYEQQEALAAEVERAQSGLNLRKTQLGTALERQTARMPGLESELGVLTSKRDEARPDVRRDVLARYDQLRRRGTSVLAKVENKACGACRVGIPAMRLSEMRRGVDIFICDNCGRYMAP